MYDQVSASVVVGVAAARELAGLDQLSHPASYFGYAMDVADGEGAQGPPAFLALCGRARARDARSRHENFWNSQPCTCGA